MKVTTKCCGSIEGFRVRSYDADAVQEWNLTEKSRDVVTKITDANIMLQAEKALQLMWIGLARSLQGVRVLQSIDISRDHSKLVGVEMGVVV